MKIYVKNISVVEKDIELIVESLDTILSVKKQINTVKQIEVQKQILIFNQVQLQDIKTLQDYNIINGATINLIVKKI